MSHDLYIETHETLIVEAMDADPTLSEDAAELLTEPRVYVRMVDDMAYATDRYIDDMFDRAATILETQVAPVRETLASIEERLGL
ncbi:MAG: hypothetical protein GY835_19825 [bacterium]|nr:hypothetical protein [bacterium]